METSALALSLAFACAAPRNQRQVAAAVSRVGALAPAAARASLAELSSQEGEEGLRGHPGLAALLSVRAKGLKPSRGVYCARPKHWVGVETADGRLFRLPLGEDGAVDLSRLAEAPRPAAAAPLPALDPELGSRLRAGAVAVALALGVPTLRDALAPAPLALPSASFDDYCGRRRCRSRRARATIDTDGWIADPGLRARISDPDYDRHHQDETSLAYAGLPESDPARYLDSTRIPYVVKHRDSPWRLGDIVVIEHEGRRLAAIVGDEGRRRRINEISHAAASALGIDPNGNSGGTEEPIKVTALRGVAVPEPSCEAEVLSKLGAVQAWLDAR